MKLISENGKFLMTNLMVGLLIFLFMIGCVIISCSCIAIKSIPMSVALGKIDVSKKPSILESMFVCPVEINDFSIVFEDDVGGQRNICSHPQWPLTLRIKIAEKATHRQVVNRVLTNKQMQFTNWAIPFTTIRLDISENKWLGYFLEPKKEYLLSIEVIEPYRKLGTGEVFLWRMEPSWFGSRKRKEKTVLGKSVPSRENRK